MHSVKFEEKEGFSVGVEKYRSWLNSELKTQSMASQSHDYATRKKANLRHEMLGYAIRLLDEYGQLHDAQEQRNELRSRN